MKSFKLTPITLGRLINELTKILESTDKPLSVSVKEYRKTRSLSQNALFHVWVSSLSEFLIKKGRAGADVNFCKDLLKHTFLGYEDKEMVNAVTGDKTVKSCLKHTSKLDAGEMYHFMEQVYAWCVGIGFIHNLPLIFFI